MKLTESHFYFVANYSVLSDIFEFSKRVVENFVHFMQFSGHVYKYEILRNVVKFKTLNMEKRKKIAIT